MSTKSNKSSNDRRTLGQCGAFAEIIGPSGASSRYEVVSAPIRPTSDGLKAWGTPVRSVNTGSKTKPTYEPTWGVVVHVSGPDQFDCSYTPTGGWIIDLKPEASEVASYWRDVSERRQLTQDEAGFVDGADESDAF